MTAEPRAAAEARPAATEEPSGWRRVVRAGGARIAAGQRGPVPVLLALAAVWVVFQVADPSFLSSVNLVNLALQSAATGIVALGVVIVLLIGQIDLSVGAVGSLAGAILGVTFVGLGWDPAASILAALASGAVIGALYGLIYVRFGAPSFVITLAGLLAALGLQTWLLNAGGSVGLPNASWPVWFARQAFLPAWAAYLAVAAATLLWAGVRWLSRARRRRLGLDEGPAWPIVVGGLALAATLGAGAWYLNQSRGVPAIFVLFLGLVVVADVLLRRTRWGRAVFAVGGGAEASRRAGIRVGAVTVSAFVLCSTLAALGGVVAASRLAAATEGGASDDLYLTAIAAAVIGGTSLFGGRGSAYSALFGVVVIQSIASGLTLLTLDASARLLLTGAVLLVAVIIDSLGRRRTAPPH